jgi:dCTP deaminase
MPARVHRIMPDDLDLDTSPEQSAALPTMSGLLPRQEIRKLVLRKMVQATAGIEETQFQPASLDLRLGAKAYRIRASFLPGADRTVAQRLEALASDEITLDGGAVLDKGFVYLVELQEFLRLPPSIAALANPKSSTGRLDVFTRLIADGADAFDAVPGGYDGPLYAEISPRSFSIRVRRGTRLNQIRFRRRVGLQGAYAAFHLSDKDLAERHAAMPLVDGEPTIRNGLVFRIDLSSGLAPDGVVGYRAKPYTDVIDLDRIAAYDVEDYWEPVRARPLGQLLLDPNEFYILASAERLHIPPDLAAEMVPIDPMMGEFRVHYAGFFDPGFGWSEGNMPGSRGVLEVRSHEVPFLLEDRQAMGRLVFERLAGEPDVLYGRTPVSNYQGQGLKLSKHFR